MYKNKVSQPINIDKCDKIVIGFQHSLVVKSKMFQVRGGHSWGMSFLFSLFLKFNRKDDYHAINSS
ncbi:hypothetical protein COC69_01170 [Bacillus cereus]|uniref:Uncharacterized protein n=1 Tax=Bacillus cereus TaxID=1396 RepID=A0A9X7CT35_BACCE|nr:hypothetical protein COC69_01170 [Bacillus cereus]